MLLQYGYLNASAGEKESKHHAGRSTAHNAAGCLQSLRRHASSPPVVSLMMNYDGADWLAGSEVVANSNVSILATGLNHHIYSFKG
jgi:hypothetical protein